jgi:predicted  nucleic acid-binding Zn-ribbon protein
MIELGKVTSNRYGAIELKKLLDAGASTLDARELEYLHYALPFDEILERIRSGAIKEHFVPEEKEPIWKCLGCNYENDKEEIPFTCPDCGKWNTFRKFAASRIDEVLIEFPDDPDEVAYLADRDPSGKHAYLRWMMHRVINDTQMEDRVADAVERFHKLKGRLVKKDLWQYKSLDELEDAVEEAGLTRKEEKDLGSRMVQEFSDGAILQILSPGASCQYGANTKWCLSEKDGEQFMSHSEAHDIYFFVPKHGSEVGKWAVLTELGTKEADAAYSALDKKFFFRDMPDNIRKHFEAAGFKGVVETLYRFEDSVGTLYLSSDQIYDALEEYRVDAHGPVFMNIIKIEMLPSTREDLIPRDQIDDTREYFRSIREGEVIETTVYDSWKDTKAIVLRDESNDIIAAFDTLEENKYYLESAIAEGIVDKSLEDWSWEEEEIPDADYNWYNLLGMNEVFPERTGPDSETTIMTPTGPTILKDANKKLRGLESLAGSMPVEAVDKIEEIDPENQRGYLNWIVEQVNVEARPLATPDDVGKEAIAFHRHMSPVQGIITDYDSGDEFIINGRAVRSPRLRDIDPDKARSLFSELVQSVADFHVQREHTPAIQDIKNADDLRDMTQRASHRPDRDKAAEGRHRLSDKVTKYTNKDAMYFDWSGKSDWCVSKWAAPEWDSYQAAGKEIYVVEIPEPYAVAVAGGSLSEVVNLRNKAVEQEDENDMDTWYGVRDTLREALNLPEAFGTIREAVERENDWRAEKNIHSYYDVDDLTARWHENGLHDPEWLTLFDFDEYENAASWAKDKFTPAEADKWMRYPFTVGYSWRAAEWRDAGFTPSEANQMITKSRNKSPPKKAAKETIPLGQCYPFVNELAEEWWDQHIDKDSPPGENVHPDIDDKNKFKVVYGKITDKWSGESALHAWVEKGDLVFDWQTSQTKPNGVQKDVYYDTFQPETDQEYTAEQALIECATGKYRVST